MSELNSLKIIGEGHIFNGEYNNITIIGEAIGNGSFKCNSLKIIGTCNTKEEASFNKMKVMGEFFTENLLSGDTLEVMGQLTASKNLKVNNIKLYGTVKVDEALVFENMNVLGELFVSKNCEGTTLESSGKLMVEGLLTADTININPREFSVINEIGGSTITIKEKGIKKLFTTGSVKANSIEGDRIILQNTECKVVRGHDITILDGCSIDKIEYTGKLTVDKNSRVGEEICLKN